MALKLDTTIPQVWRDPFSLQFGIDPARVILRELTSAQERVLWALSSGVSRSGLGMIAQSAGVEEREVARLLEALDPVLAQTDAAMAAPQPMIAIVGTGVTVEHIAGTLAESGARVTVAPSPGDEPCDLGIVVGHYVLDPPSYGFWLRRDIPHLPVIFGDASATVGPLIEPGVGPCLYCLEHHRRDADAAWPAIASQLWGRRSAAESPLVSREVAAMVARLALRRFGPGQSPTPTRMVRVPSAGASFRLSVPTGEITRTEWMPHPECGCIAVPDTNTAIPANAARREIDSAVERLRGSTPLPPRRAGVAAEPA